MNIKYKTELVQPTGPEMRQGYAVLLYALTCVLRALFTGVRYAHDVWQKHLLHEKAERRGSQDSTAASQAAARRRRENKSGADMATEYAEAAEKKVIQVREESTESDERKQVVIKKLSKSANMSREAAREAEEAADVARKNGGSKAAKRAAAKKDDAAKRAAKKTRKVIKKAGSGDDNNSGEDGSAESHITQVLQSLAGGPCWKMFKSLLSELKLPYSKKNNSLYGFDDMCRVLVAVCVGDDNAPSIDGQCKRGIRDIKKGGKRGRGKGKQPRMKGGHKMPSRQWVFRLINSVRPDYMISRCNIMLYRSVLQARRRGMLRGAVDVSIDMHDIPFYAKCMRLVYAVKSRSKDGTHTFNQLATIHCVTSGHRLTLGVEVVRREDETADVVGRLLERCSKKGIAISSLTMDRGFYSVSVINEVKKRGVQAVMPAVKTSRVKEEIRKRDSGENGAVVQHTISSRKDSASYTLIILKREKKKLAIDDEELKVLDELYGNKDDDGKDKVIKKYYVFATTMDGEWMRDEEDGGDPYAIAKFYKRRWGIENSYKCHEQIRPRTTSTKYQVRILWWFLPFVLYNAWILGRFLTSRKTGMQDTEICTLGEFVSYIQVAAFDDDPEREKKGKPPPD